MKIEIKTCYECPFRFIDSYNYDYGCQHPYASLEIHKRILPSHDNKSIPKECPLLEEYLSIYISQNINIT